MEPIVPVLVRLFHYAGTPLTAWVQGLLQETGHLWLDSERALAAFLKESGSRCFFLFDGLNEVPVLAEKNIRSIAKQKVQVEPLVSERIESREGGTVLLGQEVIL